MNSRCSASWWGSFSLATLTDAINQSGAAQVNTGQLQTDLTSFNATLLPCLSASYLAVYSTDYAPTANALQTILSAGAGSASANALQSAIQAGEFTANINEEISLGGDSSAAATWFLFNLWITLKALDASFDVDGCINAAIASGLDVPAEVQAGNWWSGSYTSYFAVLSGTDILTVYPSVRTIIEMDMPVQENDCWVRAGCTYQNDSVSNGYCQSLTYWGALNTYNPPSSSCFGGETGVLMADGTVKKINLIQPGDIVYTDQGNRKVILVEAPNRDQRTLYQFNGLDLWVTPGHPFRQGNSTNGKRVAIDVWQLMDGVPSMIAEGVNILTVGAQVNGLFQGEQKDIRIDIIDKNPSQKTASESVYDLILENWEKGHPTYYVGGPGTFFATEAETVDPYYNIPVTCAIVSIMETALSACREKNLNYQKIATLIDRINVNRVIHNVEWSQTAEHKQVKVPGPTFYQQDGKWDLIASALEYHLVKKFGRAIRRFSTHNWEKTNSGLPSDHLLICIHDLELLSEIDLQIPLQLMLTLTCKDPNIEIIKSTTIEQSEKSSWHILLDKVIDLGKIENIMSGGAQIKGNIISDSGLVAVFKATILLPNRNTNLSEIFLFSPQGNILGRVAISQRVVNAKADNLDYGTKKSLPEAISSCKALGKIIGAEIIQQL
jgi:hypothetical protein